MTLGLLLVPGATLPAVDAELSNVWRQTVYQAARETAGSVDGPLRAPGTGRNYYRLDLRTAGGDRLAMMLNAAVRLVAGCRSTTEDSVALVFDVVPSVELFLGAGFRVAGPAELQRPLRPAQVARLSDVERRDVAYHDPHRVGDALFNWFD